jgi:hypothetical protein
LKSVDALLHGLIDYAGLFPPASEDMRPALENYASYFAGADRNALGRFIVPVSRLSELEQAGSDLMPRGKGTDPWRLSVLVADDALCDRRNEEIRASRHSSRSRAGRAIIDVAELKASTVEKSATNDVRSASLFTAYFEIPVSVMPRRW